MVRVGIIGTGGSTGIARRHAQGLSKDRRAKITAVLSGSADRPRLHLLRLVWRTAAG